MSMDGLRQGAKQLNNGKGKGTVRSSYYARWKPPQLSKQVLDGMTPEETRGVQVAEPIVLVSADYEDNYQKTDEYGRPITSPVIQPAHRFREHTFAVAGKSRTGKPFKSFRSLTCSAGTDPHAPQPCVGCYYNDHGEDCAPRDQWAFNMAHLAWYHLKPLVKDNQIVYRKDKPTEPVMIREECLTYNVENTVIGRAERGVPQGQGRAKTCEGCQQQAQFTWGEHRILQVGKGQLNNIIAFDDDLKKICANCNTFLITIAYVCEKCKEDILDVAASGFTNAQLKQFADNPVQCQICQHVAKPVAMYDCGYDQKMNKVYTTLADGSTVTGGCPEHVDPRPLSIFDVVLWVQREGESTKSEIVIKNWAPISQFTMPDGAPSPDGRPLSEVMKDIVKSTFNMAEMYSPQKLEDQAKLIEHQNPYAPQGPQYAQYGTPPGGPQPAGGYGPPGYQPQSNPGQMPMAGQGYPNIPIPGRPNYGK